MLLKLVTLVGFSTMHAVQILAFKTFSPIITTFDIHTLHFSLSAISKLEKNYVGTMDMSILEQKSVIAELKPAMDTTADYTSNRASDDAEVRLHTAIPSVLTLVKHLSLPNLYKENIFTLQ